MTNSVVKLTLPGGRGYDIRIGAGANASLGERVAELTPYRSAALVVDSNVAPLYAADIASNLEAAGFAVATFSFDAGEESKTLAQAGELHAALSSYRFARDSVVVALGGGVTGDLAGFVASTYMRGVPFVQVPTTLLSMIDSSVGGKNGVNVAGVKNLVGNFAQPIYVSADLDVLRTLPELEWRCGFAEMAKSAIIDSSEFAAWLFDAAPALVAHEPERLREAVARTVAFKARVVVADERESSLRACLNYGHTLGHAIEAVADNPRVHHGIAVAEGMRFAATVAADVLGTAPGFAEAQDQLLSTLGVEPMARRFDADALVDKMVHDKKGDGTNVRFVLAKAPGDWEITALGPDVLAPYVRTWMDKKE
ncbi:MAG: 3-dehydroquinate synthase [Coriobacteriales bacterium]|jgi:3-dehydroquinate synthase